MPTPDSWLQEGKRILDREQRSSALIPWQEEDAVFWSAVCTGECGSLCHRDGCKHHGPERPRLSGYYTEDHW